MWRDLTQHTSTAHQRLWVAPITLYHTYITVQTICTVCTVRTWNTYIALTQNCNFNSCSHPLYYHTTCGSVLTQHTEICTLYVRLQYCSYNHCCMAIYGNDVKQATELQNAYKCPLLPTDHITTHHNTHHITTHHITHHITTHHNTHHITMHWMQFTLPHPPQHFTHAMTLTHIWVSSLLSWQWHSLCRCWGAKYVGWVWTGNVCEPIPLVRGAELVIGAGWSTDTGCDWL